MSWLPEHFDVFAGADVSAHKEAGKELTLVSVISAAPFLVGMVAFLLVKPAPFEQEATPLSYLEAVFLRGQLFLISVSFLATSLHRLFNSDRSYRRPDIINVFSVILFGIIGVFYGINPAFAHSDDSTVVGMSLIFFVMSLLFYYYTAVLAYERPPSVERTLEVSSAGLQDRLDLLRKGAADE